MRKWIVVIAMCLLSLLAQTSRGGEYEPNDILTGYDGLLEMGASDPNNGFTLGLYAQEAAEPGEGGLVTRLGYDIGRLNVYTGFDIQSANYWDFGLTAETFDLAEQEKVPYLSDLILIFFHEEAEVTGKAGFGHAYESNNEYSYNNLGLSIKPDKKVPVTYEPEVHFPIGKNPTYHLGIQAKF